MIHRTPRQFSEAVMDAEGFSTNDLKMISYIIGIPSAFVRKKQKEYGICKRTEGEDVHHKNVLVVEDVVTSGGRKLSGRV